MDKNLKRDLLMLLGVGFLFFIFGSWVLSLTSPDEGRNAYAALHMLKSGDWIAPYYNCHPRFEKPPLLYWLMAISFKLFGANAFAARLVSGISAFGTMIVIYLLGRKFFNNTKQALFAAITFALFLHVWIESRSATPEMLLVFFSTLGVYLFLIEKLTLGWLALGFAFLTKGPVGVILPLGVYYVWNLTEGEGIKKISLKVLKKTFDYKGLLLFLLIGSSWYLMMLYKFGWDYFYAFFVQQNIDRFLGKLGAHRYPFWYYIPIVLISIVLFLPLVPRIVKNFDRKLIPLVSWFFLVFTFYSLSKEKLHHYILFAYPPLALILARYLTERYLKTALILGVIGIITLTGIAHIYEQERFTPKAVKYLKEVKPKRLYFFRDENSALVFYLYRCIPNKDKLSELPHKTYFVTKEKYLPLIERAPETYYLILAGKEFGKKKEYLFFKD